jgi:hypothetical protein
MTEGKHGALRIKLRDLIAGAKGTKLFVRSYDLATLLDYISELEDELRGHIMGDDL